MIRYVLFALLLSIDGSVANTKGYDACQVVLTNLVANSKSSRYMVYQNGYLDTIRGFGDMAAGVIGAIMLANKTGRAFRILWPHLDEFFFSPYFDWTYKPEETNISSTKSWPYKRDGIFKHSEDGQSVSINWIDHLQMEETDVEAMGKYKSVFILANFIHTIHYHDLNKTDLLDFQRCMLPALWKPRPEFLHDTFELEGGHHVGVGQLFRAMSDPNTYSLAIHMRLPDELLYDARDHHLSFQGYVAMAFGCAFLRLENEHHNETNRVVFIGTQGQDLGILMASQLKRLNSSIKVFLPNAKSLPHIVFGAWQEKDLVNMTHVMQESRALLKSVIVPWLAMAHASALILGHMKTYGHISGYSVSASLAARPDKRCYRGNTCEDAKVIDLCSARYC